MAIAEQGDGHMVAHRLRVAILVAPFTSVPAATSSVVCIAASCVENSELQSALFTAGFNFYAISMTISCGNLYRNMIHNAAPAAGMFQSQVHARPKAGARRRFFQSFIVGLRGVSQIAFQAVASNGPTARKDTS
jgi:hypothetical protein